MINLGDFPVNATIYVPFNTFSSVGASVTITGLAVTDIEIYKDGSSTQRASDAGYALLDTDGIDFDGITGIHGFSIDLSDNTDAGFYAAGHEYWVVVASITCDGQTVNFVAATFSIDRWYNQAITRGQVKIAANAANEGALDIRNANAAGHGTLNDGGSVGLYSSGGTYGQYNAGTSDYGVINTGGDSGQYNTGVNYGVKSDGGTAGNYNLGNGGVGYGQYNAGDAIGQYNAGSGAGSAGQANQGIAQGQHNNGATGQQNDGGAVGQYNTGTTYGAQNTGASGLVNVGTAGDGIYASGTDYGIQAAGATGDIYGDITGSVDSVTNAVTVGGLNAAALKDFFDTDSGDTYAGSVAGSVVKEIVDNAAGGAPTVFPTGAINFTYTVTDSATTLPIEGVEVWFSTDNPPVNIVWKGDTDAFGVARDVLGNLPALDAGIYFVSCQKAGYTFVIDTEVVS